MITSTNSTSSTKKLAKIAMLTAISFILYMWVKFPLPFMFPAFLDLQISELPALIGGFSMGPLAGCAIIVVKCLLKMPFSSTGTVGEIADIIVGIAYVLPASLIYKRYKNKKGAIIALLTGLVSSVAFAVIANRFLLIPFFVQVMFGGNWQPLLGMVAPLYPTVTVDNFYTFYLLLAAVPFNLLRGCISALIAFFCYKRLRKVL